MKKRILTLVATLILLCLAFASCGAPANGGDLSLAPEKGEYGDITIDSEGATLNEQKLIVTVSYTIETLTFDETLDALAQAVKSAGGYIEESRINPYQGSGTRGYAYLTLRVPTQQADAMSHALESVGKVTSHSENTDDVTLHYTDVQARIQSLEAQYTRVLALYDTAKTLNELITVEKRLTEISSELTSLKNQMKALENKVSYATFHVTLYDVQAYSEEEPETYWQEFGRSFVDSFRVFVTVLGKILIVILYLLPYLLVAGGIVFLVIWHKRRKKKKNTPKQ